MTFKNSFYLTIIMICFAQVGTRGNDKLLLHTVVSAIENEDLNCIKANIEQIKLLSRQQQQDIVDYATKVANDKKETALLSDDFKKSFTASMTLISLLAAFLVSAEPLAYYSFYGDIKVLKKYIPRLVGSGLLASASAASAYVNLTGYSYAENSEFLRQYLMYELDYPIIHVTCNSGTILFNSLNR